MILRLMSLPRSPPPALPDMASPKRILLKLSGEALMGEDPYGINRQTIDSIVKEIAQVTALGVEVAVVIGGGNIFRGVALGASGMDRGRRREKYFQIGRAHV